MLYTSPHCHPCTYEVSRQHLAGLWQYKKNKKKEKTFTFFPYFSWRKQEKFTEKKSGMHAFKRKTEVQYKTIQISGSTLSIYLDLKIKSLFILNDRNFSIEAVRGPLLIIAIPIQRFVPR